MIQLLNLQQVSMMYRHATILHCGWSLILHKICKKKNILLTIFL